MNNKKLFTKKIVLVLISFFLFFSEGTILFAQNRPVFPFKSGTFIKEWLICGPFPARSARSLYHDFLTEKGGENKIMPVNGMQISSSSVPRGKVSWKMATAQSDGKLDLRKYLQPNQNNISYAGVTIRCDQRTPALLKLGSNDMIAVWLNGERIYVFPDPRASGPDADKVAVTLKKGDNLLLAKVQNVGGGWWLYARFDKLFALDKDIYTTAPSVSPVPKRINDHEIADIYSVMLYNSAEQVAGPVQISMGKKENVMATQESLKPGTLVWLKGVSPVSRSKLNDSIETDVMLTTPLASRSFHISIKHFPLTDGITWFVQGFHVDPVWRDSQSGYQALSFSNLDQYLRAAQGDSGYDFLMSEIPYLKPYYDIFPADRPLMRKLIKTGRGETCGSYNQPNETTISGEALIRNILYGRLFHENVLHDYPRVYQPWDVFGHIIQLPQILKKSEFIGTVWERSNYRSSNVRVPGIPDLYFAQSPDGTMLPTRKVSYGFPNPNGRAQEVEIETRKRLAEDMREQQQQIKGISYDFRLNAIDEKAPTAWMIGRSDVFRTFIPKVSLEADGAEKYFEHIEKQEKQDHLDIPVVSRDVSQYNEGCELSRFDLKMGNRLGENTLIAAEKFATLANILGMPYPDIALDEAWRQLLYGQHHDGVTGCGADEPYLDLAGGYHKALDLGNKSLTAALRYIAGHINTSNTNREAIPVVVYNSLNWERNDIVQTVIRFKKPVKGFRLINEKGKDVSLMVRTLEKKGKHILSAGISFIAEKVPSLGYKTWWIVPDKSIPQPETQVEEGGTVIENEFFRLAVDKRMGGGITSLLEKGGGKEYINTSHGHPGNELILLKEGPGFEPAWRFLTTGEKYFSKDYPVQIKAYKSPLYEKLVITGEMPGMKKRIQEITLYHGLRRIDFRTRLVDYQGQNGKNIAENDTSSLRDQRDLYVIGFPANLTGSVPVLEDRFATKTYYRSKEYLSYSSTNTVWTTHHSMNSCYQWFDNSWSVKVNFGGRYSVAPGPSEIVTSRDTSLRKAGFRLQTALAQNGVTATPAYPDIKRDYDIQYRRFCFSAGSLEGNSFNAKLMDHLTDGARQNIRLQLQEQGYAYAFVYDKNLQEAWFAYPVLMIIGKNEKMTEKALDRLTTQLHQTGNISLPAGAWLAGGKNRVGDYGLAIINRGNLPVSTENDGTMVLALMHTIPWQSPLLHWTHDFPERKTHVFDYALYPHKGNWQDANMVFRGYEFNNPLMALQTTQHHEALPQQLSFLSTGKSKGVITSVKPVSAGLESFHRNTKTCVKNGMIIRMYEPLGKSEEVHIQTHFSIISAEKVNLMERQGRKIPFDTNRFSFRLTPYSIQTFKVHTSVKPVEKNGGYAPARDHPVYGRFWEQNEGAAPAGYNPVNVSIIAPPGIDRQDSRKNIRQIQVYVTNDYIDSPVKGTVIIETPPGVRAVPDIFTYRVSPDSESRYPVTLILMGQITPGFIRATIVQDSTTLFDVMPFRLPEKKFGHADNIHAGTRIKWKVTHQNNQVAVTLSNPFSQAIDGEVSLIGPVETWGDCKDNPVGLVSVNPWKQAFHLPARETKTLYFDIKPVNGENDSAFWLAAKLSYFGYLDYKPAVGKLIIQK